MKPSSQSRGFTLIELLVVIAIISLLAAMIFPVFARAKDAAYTSTCASNERQLATAIQLYVDDFDDTYPNLTGGSEGAGMVGGWMYFAKFPADPFDVTKGGLWPYVRAKGVYVCPADGEGKASGDSYALNDCLAKVVEPFLGMSYGLPTSSFKDPASMLLLAEEGDRDSASGSTNDGGLSFQWDFIGARHHGGTNVVMSDTHTKWYHAGQVDSLNLRQGPDNNCHGL